MSLSLGIDLVSLPVHYLLTRTVASGGEGGQLPPGTVEPDKSSLWMDLLSLPLVILIAVTCICFYFHGGGYRPHYKARAFGSHDNAPSPFDKKPSYGLAYLA